MTGVPAPARSAPRPRCFVALLPGAAARGRLAALTRELAAQRPGCRVVHPDDLHLTLAFLGAIDACHAAPLAARFARMPASRRRWAIDRVGCFPGARVAWAGGAPHAALEELARSVRALLDEMRLPYDRQAFAPHVTLLRHSGSFAARVLAEPIAWTLGRPQLMVSHGGAASGPRYRIWRADPAA